MGGRGGKARVILPALVATASLGLAQWLMRRVRRRMRQSEMLRAPPARLEPSTLAVGDYVQLRGTVASKDVMVSPGESVQCVRYVRRKLRVIDQRLATTTNTHTASGSGTRAFGTILGKLTSAVAGVLNPTGTSIGGTLSTQRKTEREEWGMQTQELAREEATARHVTLTDAASGACVALDLANAEFLELQIVSDVFEEEKATGARARGSDGRQTLGWRTVEEVLPAGAELIVLGEIGLTQGPDGQQMLAVRCSMPRNMLDMKTQSVARPFVASPLSYADLLHRIERSGRVYFWCALPALVTGVFALAAAAVNYRALAAGGAARGAPPPPPRHW